MGQKAPSSFPDILPVQYLRNQKLGHFTDPNIGHPLRRTLLPLSPAIEKRKLKEQSTVYSECIPYQIPRPF